MPEPTSTSTAGDDTRPAATHAWDPSGILAQRGGTASPFESSIFGPKTTWWRLVERSDGSWGLEHLSSGDVVPGVGR